MERPSLQDIGQESRFSGLTCRSKYLGGLESGLSLPDEWLSLEEKEIQKTNSELTGEEKEAGTAGPWVLSNPPLRRDAVKARHQLFGSLSSRKK